MKKLFTMMAVCAATCAVHTASAGTPIHAGKTLYSQSTFSQTFGAQNSSLRATTCDTLVNISETIDTPVVYLLSSPSEGYASGNGSLNNGTAYPIGGVGERFNAPSSGGNVTTALVFFGLSVINPSDSALTVTAYVYDTTGTAATGGSGPGAALDSATVTLRTIAQAVTQENTAQSLIGVPFAFTHNATLHSKGFFITVAFPLVTGDTVAVFTNTGNTPYGDGYAYAVGAGWLAYSTIYGSQEGNFIVAEVCGLAACPTITATATEIAHTTSADVSASGGVAPYTYSWSNTQATDTATGLVNGHTYTVTATDANGCSGTATVSISTGIESLGDISNFSIYPNPSNGVFTASIHLAAASDVTISISDVTGSKVYETTENAVKDIDQQINLGGISAGIYFVNVKTAQGTANQRIVIK